MLTPRKDIFQDVDFVWQNPMLEKDVDKSEFVEVKQDDIMGKTNEKLIAFYNSNRWNRDEIFFRLGIEKSEELLNMLRSAENPNFQDIGGFSYLHRACQSHYVEAVQILLEAGADPNINDNKGFSPVMQAIGRRNSNNAKILELMLQYGLNLDKIEGAELTLKEKIESFNDKELNRIINEHTIAYNQ